MRILSKAVEELARSPEGRAIVKGINMGHKDEDHVSVFSRAGCYICVARAKRGVQIEDRKKSAERKPTFGDMPADALWEVGKTYALGAVKHGRGGWREPGSWVDVWDAMMRHMLQWRMGEDVSADDKHYHMGAIVMRALWLLVYHLNEAKYGKFDDRLALPQHKPGKSRPDRGQRRSDSKVSRNNKGKSALPKTKQGGYNGSSKKIKAGDARNSVKR